MLFSSLTFLVFFLPCAVLGHLLLPAKARNAFLLAASVFFYAWGEIRYVPLVVGSMLLNWVFGFGAASGKPRLRALSLTASLLVNFGALAFFKYASFFMNTVGLGAYAPQVALPLGISFYTFQTQAYVVDVYRRKVPAERNFIDYATFILLFPQLIAGPIVLYEDVRREMKSRAVMPAALEEGMSRFLAGLGAKALLANPLGTVWETMRAADAVSAPYAWLGLIAYALQIYFDFYGYSLMAIGLGRMFGFHFPKNFDHPYAAVSVRQFWRRWHITLGAWFREYVYIPLGGSRGGALKTLRNLFIVWALTGLWHGANWNFVLWGLWYFALLAAERFVTGGFLRRHEGLGRVYTLLAVLLGWALFATETPADAGRLLARLFTPGLSRDVLFPLRENAVLLAVAIACCVPKACAAARGLLEKRPALRVCAMLCVLALSLAALVAEDYNPFLYFRF